MADGQALQITPKDGDGRPASTRELGFPIAVGTTIGLVVIGVAVYAWLLLARWGTLSSFGAAGDAVGPFAGLATVGALVAALWSVKLQREDLALTRKEMADSRAELSRSAKAQEDLARAQEALTIAQVGANTLAGAAAAMEKQRLALNLLLALDQGHRPRERRYLLQSFAPVKGDELTFWRKMESSYEQGGGLQSTETVAAVTLGYLEDAALVIRQQVVDEVIMYRSIGDIVVRMTEALRLFIEKEQAAQLLDKRGTPVPFCELVYLAERWSKQGTGGAKPHVA